MASWDLFSSRTRKTVKGNEMLLNNIFLFKFWRQTILYYKAFRLQIKNDILLQLLEDLFSLSTDNQNWRTNRKVNWKSENWSTIQLCQKMEKVLHGMVMVMGIHLSFFSVLRKFKKEEKNFSHLQFRSSAVFNSVGSSFIQKTKKSN